VLVLDDDPLVARALRRLLEPPHRVEELSGGRDALERLGAGARWDVVFCDLMMPDMTGMDWHAEVARAFPDLAPRVVFVTGGAFTEAARDFLRRVPNPRLEKPFEPAEVRRLAAQILSERGRAP
jgi:CheY-like chemotaxis protein